MQIPRPEIPESITVTSPNFAAGDHIPTRFTCKGAGIAPAFGWVGVPTRARALAVVVSDPDAPRGTFLHWLVTGLAAADGGIEEGGSAPAGSREWPNSGRSASWVPPCPPVARTAISSASTPSTRQSTPRPPSRCWTRSVSTPSAGARCWGWSTTDPAATHRARGLVSRARWPTRPPSGNQVLGRVDGHGCCSR